MKTYTIDRDTDKDEAGLHFAKAEQFIEGIYARTAEEEGEAEGAGFCILHAGEAGIWLLVDWWAHKDILCQRLAFADYTSGQFASVDHRPLHACVWEQIIHAHERNAWVKHMMTPSPDLEAYLADQLGDGLY